METDSQGIIPFERASRLKGRRLAKAGHEDLVQNGAVYFKRTLLGICNNSGVIVDSDQLVSALEKTGIARNRDEALGYLPSFDGLNFTYSDFLMGRTLYFQRIESPTGNQAFKVFDYDDDTN